MLRKHALLESLQLSSTHRTCAQQHEKQQKGAANHAHLDSRNLISKPEKPNIDKFKRTFLLKAMRS
jgi:hypothetical protein